MEQAFIELVWTELKKQCASNPKVAVRLVMVNKADVDLAMREVLRIWFCGDTEQSGIRQPQPCGA